MLIAQISDIHASPGSTSLTVLDAVVAWLANLPLDAVVVSGDLVDNGWEPGYGLIDRKLAALRCPIYALPGNSDNPRSMFDALANRMPWAAPTGPMHFVAHAKDVRIIGLDVTVPQQSYGDALPHLDWLATQLALTDAPTLIVMHQPPMQSGIDVMDAICCRHADELGAVLEAAAKKPLAIVCGHVHRPIVGMLGSIPVHICGSICPPNPLMLGDAPPPPVTDGPSILIHAVARGRWRSHVVAFPASPGGS